LCGQPVPFLDRSTIAEGANVQWTWELGDSVSITEQNPQHIYSQAGVYDITLTVISDSGCISSLTKKKSVEIYPLPFAQFRAYPDKASIVDPRIQFIDAGRNGVFMGMGFW
jgi:PKD repeat protein